MRRQRIIPEWTQLGAPQHRRPPSFCCAAPKKHACANDLEKSKSQFGWRLTCAIERRFRRSSRSLTRRRTPKAIRRSGSGPKTSAVDSRGGGSRWSAGRRSAPAAGDSRKGTFCGARRARSASGWQHPSAWRGPHFGASRRSIAVLVAWLGFAWRSVAYRAGDDARCLNGDSDADASRERERLHFCIPPRPSPNDRDVV